MKRDAVCPHCDRPLRAERGAEFRAARQAAGVTLAVVARALGVSISYVSDVERGYRPPPLDWRPWFATLTLSETDAARVVDVAGVRDG